MIVMGGGGGKTGPARSFPGEKTDYRNSHKISDSDKLIRVGDGRNLRGMEN